MSGAHVDIDAVFDEDYLYFYGGEADARADAETDVIWRLLELQPGMELLDLACGHGRLAGRLAGRGCRVTGLDATPLFLDLARGAAADRGVTVDYVKGDMRSLPWTGRFDRVINWFTAFGYFGDAENRQVLGQVARALGPGGRLAIELQHRDWVIGHFRPAGVVERDGDLLIDQRTVEPLTGCVFTERTVIRGGRMRRTGFAVRLFNFTELRDWLLDAGFAAVHGYGGDGGPLAPESRRMIVVADR